MASLTIGRDNGAEVHEFVRPTDAAASGYRPGRIDLVSLQGEKCAKSRAGSYQRSGLHWLK